VLRTDRRRRSAGRAGDRGDRLSPLSSSAHSREGLHNAKAPRIAGFRRAKPAPECAAKDQQEKKRSDEEGDCRSGIRKRFALEKRITNGQHRGGSLGKTRQTRQLSIAFQLNMCKEVGAVPIPPDQSLRP
jgi:hypothetical protein